MIFSYSVQYMFKQGPRTVQEELTVFASSEIHAIQKVADEVARRFGSPPSLHIHTVHNQSPILTQQTIPYL